MLSACCVRAPSTTGADPGPPSHVRHAHLSAMEVTGRRAAGHRGLEGRMCSACSGGAQRMRTSHAWGGGSKQAELTWTRTLRPRQELPKMDSEHTGSCTGSQWSLWALPLLRNQPSAKISYQGHTKSSRWPCPHPQANHNSALRKGSLFQAHNIHQTLFKPLFVSSSHLIITDKTETTHLTL